MEAESVAENCCSHVQPWWDYLSPHSFPAYVSSQSSVRGSMALQLNYHAGEGNSEVFTPLGRTKSIPTHCKGNELLRGPHHPNDGSQEILEDPTSV